MTPVEPDVDRLRRAFAALSERAAATAGCPDPDRLWAAVRGELPPEATRGLVDHTVACGACAEAWRLGREMGAALPAGQARAAVRPRSWWGSRAGLLAAAAAVVVATAVVWQRPVGGPEFREGGTFVPRSRVPEGRPLPRSQCVLRWSPGPPGSRYDVRVATEALEPVATGRGLGVAEYRVPDEALASLAGGTRLLWQVEALLPDGSRWTSPTFVVRIE